MFSGNPLERLWIEGLSLRILRIFKNLSLPLIPHYYGILSNPAKFDKITLHDRLRPDMISFEATDPPLPTLYGVAGRSDG